MKIELQVKGKEVIIPKFKILKEDKDTFAFVFVEQIAINIQNEINSKISKIKFENNALILELSNCFFYFDISGFKTFSESKIINVGFVFYDKFDKILDIKTKIFTYAINSQK